MAPRLDDIMRLCCDVSANQQMKAAVQHSTRGAVVAGGTAFVGGLLAGPAGIAVGKKRAWVQMTDHMLTTHMLHKGNFPLSLF